RSRRPCAPAGSAAAVLPPATAPAPPRMQEERISPLFHSSFPPVRLHCLLIRTTEPPRLAQPAPKLDQSVLNPPCLRRARDLLFCAAVHVNESSRGYIVALEKGDELVRSLVSFARQYDVDSAT